MLRQGHHQTCRKPRSFAHGQQCKGTQELSIVNITCGCIMYGKGQIFLPHVPLGAWSWG